MIELFLPCLPESECSTKALKIQLVPLTRAISACKAAEAMTVVHEKPAESAETTENAESAESVPDGDVTSSLAKDMTQLERKQLVETLNKQAAQERGRNMRESFLKAAAGNL